MINLIIGILCVLASFIGIGVRCSYTIKFNYIIIMLMLLIYGLLSIGYWYVTNIIFTINHCGGM